ncbi:hypothetical protein Fcan01_19062 [Folsomia candida]|uniref:Uncharacterized protein n=1 Tax=Folsomia candida TaxID=158441 RepID=A0A226DNC8_FOLCA|nr:hypothetical protein Fcan01_19062 [Folsomia candida]
MMFSSVVPLVQLQLKYLSNLGLQLIKWNAKRHQFFSTGSNQRNIRLVLGTLFVIVLNGFYTIFLQRHHARSLVQLFTAAFATALAITSTILCKPDPFVYLMNMTIQFEAKCFPKLESAPLWKIDYMSGWRLALWFCCWSTLLVSIVGPSCVIAITLYQPNLPPFLGSMLPIWENDTPCAAVMHMAVSLYQAWTLYVLGIAFSLAVGHIFFGILLSVTMYITSLTRTLGWNSSSKISKIGIQYYKQVEILISHLNYCFRPVVLPAILLYAIAVNILNGQI